MPIDSAKQSTPGFAVDIKPLFTQLDRDHMMKMFDLWKYDDVKASAAGIYKTLQDQSMPPKGSEPQAPWPVEDVALFKAWMDAGCAP
ncbi:MAG: hypothetical protein M3Y21_03145 [Candidatus Eremiobacteraeota bacterium]|nr:hypothetical protein [Candidatus Eremiobacteraeota bacterium]